MNKQEIIAEIATDLEQKQRTTSKVEIGYILDSFFELVSDVTTNPGANADTEIAWPGFGKLHRVVSPARQGRNPHSGETIQIAAKGNVKFKPSTTLKTRAAPIS